MTGSTGRKAMVYAAIAIALCIGIRWWGNSQWRKGEEQGRKAATAAVEKAKRAEWSAREKEIEAGSARLAVDRAAVEEARKSLAASVRRQIAASSAEREKGYEIAAAVPDAAVWRELRAVSAGLASQ
jgi:hypothetical protein